MSKISPRNYRETKAIAQTRQRRGFVVGHPSGFRGTKAFIASQLARRRNRHPLPITLPKVNLP